MLRIKFKASYEIGLNSLRPSDAIWRQWSWTTLAQVMACCLTAPSHYLNQCWLIIRGVLWHTSESSFAGIAQGIDSGYEFEKDILKNIFKSPRGQWVKWMPQMSFDAKSTLVRVMAWCRQATSHYLSQCRQATSHYMSQCWPNSLSPHGVNRPQWVELSPEKPCCAIDKKNTGIIAYSQPWCKEWRLESESESKNTTQ